MFIDKVSLPRRTFLRGVGVTLALPFLDAMVPAATAAARVVRLDEHEQAVDRQGDEAV